MTKMIVNDRIDQIVFSNMDSSLEKLQEELLMLGIGNIDVNSFKANLSKHLNEFYTPEDDGPAPDDRAVIFKIGKDGENVPECVTASILVGGLRQVLINFIDGPLKDLEDIQDKKIQIWAQNVAGEKNVAVDYERLQIIDPSIEKAITIINITKQLLESNHKELIQMSKEKLNDNRNGIKIFAQDFCKAILSNTAFEELLNNLLKAETAEIVDEVVQHPVVLDSEHSRVIVFFAEQLKIKLRLPSQKTGPKKIKAAA